MASELEDLLTESLRELSRLEGVRDSFESRKNQLQSDLVRLSSEENVLLESSTVIRTLSEKEVHASLQAIEQLLTTALQTVFPEYEMWVTLVPEIKNNKVSVEICTFQKNGEMVVEGDGLESFGGAINTLHSIMLRAFTILRWKMKPFMVFDESLRTFNELKIPEVANLLKTLVTDFGFDILCITHSLALEESSNRCYKIVPLKGASTFEMVV